MSIAESYLNSIKADFNSLKTKGDRTLNQLTDDDLHWRHTEYTNNISIIVKHVSGNLRSRWTKPFTTDGEKHDRDRDSEFIDDLTSKQEIFEVWESGWSILFDVLHSLHPNDLDKTIYIRGEAHTLLEGLQRQLTHYAMHIGQMMHIAKEVKGVHWESLSIPLGESEAYTKATRNNHSN